MTKKGEEALKNENENWSRVLWGDNFGKLSEEKSIFRSSFSLIWKERTSRFFHLYFMKMKQSFEPDIHLTLRQMPWEDML